MYTSEFLSHTLKALAKELKVPKKHLPGKKGFDGVANFIVNHAVDLQNRNRAEADEFIQDLLIQVQRDTPRFEGKNGAKWTTWIGTISKNNYFKHFRPRYARDITGSHEFLDSIKTDEYTESPEVGYFARIDKRLKLKHVKEALNSLIHRHRVAFALKHLEGKSYAEIGKLMGEEEPTVKAVIHRAKVNVANYLREKHSEHYSHD